jgi:hypothetical protein
VSQRSGVEIEEGHKGILSTLLKTCYFHPAGSDSKRPSAGKLPQFAYREENFELLFLDLL